MRQRKVTREGERGRKVTEKFFSCSKLRLKLTKVLPRSGAEGNHGERIRQWAGRKTFCHRNLLDCKMKGGSSPRFPTNQSEQRV